jgi:manganese transport protein
MEGYLNLRIRPWIRRLITRLIAIIPALLTIQLMGESSTGKLLVFSQVILSLQLGFAIIPLIHFVSDKEKMGEFTIGLLVKFLAWTSALIIVSLNGRLVFHQIMEWYSDPDINRYVIDFVVVPVVLFALFLLLYTTIMPLMKMQKAKRAETKRKEESAGIFDVPPPGTYKRIAISVDFSASDLKTIRQAISMSGKEADYMLIHILESPTSKVFGTETQDLESQTDTEGLERYQAQLKKEGYRVETALGYGTPSKAIAGIAIEFRADLMVMGAHGHKGIKDVIFGTTIEAVRHKLQIPVMIVK